MDEISIEDAYFGDERTRSIVFAQDAEAALEEVFDRQKQASSQVRRV
jgi:hypothetical protein